MCSCVGPAAADALGPAADEDLGPGAFEDFVGGPLAEWACVGAVDVKSFAEFNAMATPTPTITRTRIEIPAATKIQTRRPLVDPALAGGCQ